MHLILTNSISPPVTIWSICLWVQTYGGHCLENSPSGPKQGCSKLSSTKATPETSSSIILYLLSTEAFQGTDEEKHNQPYIRYTPGHCQAYSALQPAAKLTFELCCLRIAQKFVLQNTIKTGSVFVVLILSVSSRDRFLSNKQVPPGSNCIRHTTELNKTVATFCNSKDCSFEGCSP